MPRVSTRPPTLFRHRAPVWLLVLVGLLCATTLTAQRPDLKILGNYRQIEIPFDLENDFIVVDIVMGGRIPVRFIVDTGAENTVLLDKKLADRLRVNYRRTFQVRGADVNNALVAYLATGVDLKIANRLLARRRSLLVLKENYFDFESITGTSIQGILGADFLMRFTCEFDFRHQLLILHEPSEYKPSRRHRSVPVDYVRNRPYLRVPVGVNRQDPTPRRLLLDSGAGLSLLLNTYGDSTDVDLPGRSVPAFIATGLGGSLQGSVGRSRTLEIGGKTLEGVVTYFQPLDTAGMDFLNDREGIVGNRILRRFNTVLDYNNRAVYLRAEPGAWKRKFRYDRSGMSVVAGGQYLNRYTVANVVPGGPADRAGLQVGDRIVSINGKSATLMSLEGIIRRFEGKVGRRFRLRYRREGNYTTVRFALEDLI